MTNEGSNKIVNFMTPGIGVPVLVHGHIGCIVKMHHFFENLATMQRYFFQNCKFHNFWGRVSLLGCCISNTVKMHCFFMNLLD